MFERSRAHNVSKVWGSLGGNRSFRESGSLGYRKAASPGAECVLEDNRPAASGEARTGPDLLHFVLRTGLRVRVLAWAHACWQEAAVPGCVHSEAAVYEAWLLLLLDVVTGQWESGVGSVGRLWQGELGISKECPVARECRKIIHFHIRGC